jgi:curved DNA-binding protein CbpA
LIPDHYKILELEPSADPSDIKKAYRRLAMRYHPDKISDDPYAREHFNAIKEAYEVLTNPGRKEKYLQQRWYQRSAGLRKTREILTPETILQQALELDKYVSRLDVHRMDHDGLSGYILDLFSPEAIGKLNAFNDLAANREITLSIMRSSSALPFMWQERIHSRLEKINNDEATITTMQSQIRTRIRNDQWNRYRIVIVFLISALLILLIFLAA